MEGKTRTYAVEFTITLTSEIEADSREEAERILSEIGPADAFHSDDWILQDSSKEITGDYGDEDEDDEEEDEEL